MDLPRPSNANEAKQIMEAWMHTYGNAFTHPNNFDKPVALECKCVHAQLEKDHIPATATFEITWPLVYSNNPNASTIHGGAIATYFDNLTSMALIATTKNYWPDQAVSRNLDVTYLRPPMVGEEALLYAEVLQCGKRAATIKGELRRKKDGAMLAFAIHEKARREVAIGGYKVEKGAKL